MCSQKKAFYKGAYSNFFPNRFKLEEKFHQLENRQINIQWNIIQ